MFRAPVQAEGVTGDLNWSYRAMPAREQQWCYKLRVRTAGKGSQEEGRCLARPRARNSRNRPVLYGDHSVRCGKTKTFFLRGEVARSGSGIEARVDGKVVSPAKAFGNSTLFLFVVRTEADSVDLRTTGQGPKEVARVLAGCQRVAGGDGIAIGVFTGTRL